MAITVTAKVPSTFGDRAAVMADLAFSGKYTYGGFSLDNDALFGIHGVDMALLESQGGYSFVHDKTNKKVKVFGPAPPICYEEKQTPSSDIVTTKYPAAFIMNVARTGTNKKLRSTGIALADLGADECCLVSVMANGVRTQIRIKDYDRLGGDGAFTSGATTNWTLDLTYWTTGSNKLAKDANSGTAGTLVHTFTPTIGRTYRLSYVISGWSVGTVTPTCGGVSMTAAGADGTFTSEFTAVSTAALTFTATDTSRFIIDTITVYDISEPIYITYVTQAWKDVWDNLVQDEAITLATGNNTLGELMATVNDRTFAGASNWTNVSMKTYDETTGGYMTLTSDAAGQYAVLPVKDAPTVIGNTYRLTLSASTLTETFQIYDFLGKQLIGTISVAGTGQTFDFTAQTLGGLRIVAVATISSVLIDNVSLSPGNKILACMYVDQTSATATALAMQDEDDTAASYGVVIRLNESINQINVHSDQDAATAKITYIKNPGSGFLSERAFDNETATKRTNGAAYLNTFLKPALLWGYTGQMPVNGGTTQRMIDSAATPGAGEFKPYWNAGSRTIPAPPPLVVEEVVTCASNVGTLEYLPLYIVAVQVTATTTTGYYNIIPVGKTPLTKQVAVDFTTGGLTFLGTDAVTSVKVTYIPKRASGYLSSVTVDEVKTSSASKVNLTARAGLVQYVWDNTDGKNMPFDQYSGGPAEHFCAVNILDTADTSIDSHANDAANTLWITYVPYTQIPPGCFVDEDAITLNAQNWNFTGDPLTSGYGNILVPGYGPQLIGTKTAGGAGKAEATWGGPTGTAGDGVAVWNPAKNSIATLNTSAFITIYIPWMILDINQLTPALPVYGGQIIDLASNVTGTGAGVWGVPEEIVTVPLEIADGTNSLSGLTSVKALFIGA